MNRRFILQFAVLLLVVQVMALGCSILPSRRHLTWTLTLEIAGQGDDQNAIVEQTIAIIKRRLDLVYVLDHKLERQGNSRVLLSLPDVADRERLKNFITTSGKLELMHVISPPSPAPVQTYNTKEDAIASLGGILVPNHRVLTFEEHIAGDHTDVTREQKRWVVVEAPPVVTGNDLRNAEAVLSGPGPDYDHTIVFSLNPSGAQRFGAWTRASINQYLAIVLNDEVRSIVYIKSQIFDQGEITGRFTKESAEDLAKILISGALPAPVKIVGENALR